jgi:hypothetical protein
VTAETVTQWPMTAGFGTTPLRCWDQFCKNRSLQTNVHEQLQAIITLLSIINPAIYAAMFARAVAGQSLAVLNRKEMTSK